MFKFIKSLRLPPVSVVEQWALRNSKHTTPDQIIAAAVIQSLAKNFDDWEKQRSDQTSYLLQDNKYPTSPLQDRAFYNKTKNVIVSYDCAGDSDCQSKSIHVNGVKVDNDLGRTIIVAYYRVANQRAKLKWVADEAKAKLERNERAWNVAEKLLGMKRNEFGALVPVDPQTS